MSTDTHSVGDSSLDNILNRVSEAVCALDDEWRFTFVNDQAGEILEYPPEELLGEDIWETVPEIEDRVIGEKLRQAVETQTPTRFDSYNEASERWFKVRIYPSDDGVTACFYDITDERGEQLDLQRKRRLFETVFEETEDALVVADTNRRITDFNPAAERLFGYDASEVMGEKSRILYADPDDYERQGQKRYNERVHTQGERYTVEYEHADGTTFEGDTLGTTIGPDGEAIAFLASIRDVSARVKYKQEIEARNDALRTFHQIATDEDRSFDEQVESLLELGADHLGLETGLLSRTESAECTVEHAVGSGGTVQPGDRFDIGETNWNSDDKDELVAVTNDGESDSSGQPVANEYDHKSYIRVPVVVDDEQYGMLNFSTQQPRQKPFTDGERTFVRVIAQWLGKELSRQRSTERAAANRDRLRQIIDILPQLVFAKDRNGEFILANQAIADAYGTTVDELEGATDADFAESEEVKQFREDDIAVIESGSPKEIPDEPLTTADGEELRFQTTKIPYDPVDHGTEAVLGVATDITERKERDAEIELQSKAMEVAMDGIAILDDDEYVYMNQAHADIFDYEPEDLLGREWRDLYDEVEMERFETAVFPSLAKDGEWQGEALGRKRDGTAVYQDLGLSLLDSGELICTNRDITEQKERERELERQQTRIRALFDQSPDGVIIHDEEGTVIDANETMTENLGVDRETLLSMNVSEFEVGITQSDLMSTWSDISMDKTLKVEGKHKRQNGEVFPVEVWVNKVEVGGKKRFIAVSRDITERKEREQALHELNERLDLAVEGGRIGIWDWNMMTDAVTFNEQWASILGFSLEELEPTLETWEKRVHPADMDTVEEQLEAHIAGETELYDCEHRMQSKSGDWKWIKDVGKVVERDDDGTPTRAVGIHLDITDQKESELFLEEERDMFVQGPAVVFKWRNDDGWPVEYVSENITETFGYTPEEIQSGAVPYMDLLHDDDIDRVADEVAANSDETTERFSHDPYRIVTSSGEIRWVTDNTKIIRSDGEITHYLGYLIDITEQKRLEQSLRDSEQSLRDLTDIASDTDQSFEEKLSALLELGRERLDIPYGFLNRMDGETQHVVQAVGDHPQLQTDATAPRSESYCKETVQQDGVLDTKDATEVDWVADSAYERFDLGCYIGGTVFVDGDRYGTLCFAGQDSRDHDFDDAKRAFVELLVQWISYELASDAFETKLQEMNDMAQRLMAAPSREEIAAITIENTKSVLDMPLNGIWWPDESNGRLAPAGMTEEATSLIPTQPTLEQGNSLAYDAFEADEVHTYDDLDDVEGLHNEDTPLRSEAIIPFGDHGVMSAGSTEPRAFSETELNLLEVLSATVEAALTRAQREETLRDTQRKLKQSNEELEQFAYAASHDLQEPLRTVSSYLTLLERRYGDKLDDDAVDFIDFAVDGADRMREMIQALLAYSRVDTRGQDFETVSAVTVFERVTQNLELSIQETDTTVTLPETDLTMTGDDSQLVQLFQNLVENGIKYNRTSPRIEISAACDDGMVTFEVTDNGIGMDSDQTAGIFEVFQRLHTREEFDGTGIGLSICRKIADRHGGEISVDSEPGEGSTFIVTLPQGETSDE